MPTSTSTNGGPCTTPLFRPQHAGEFAIRRFFAAASPYGTNRGAGGGPLWSRLRSAVRRPAPRRVLDVAVASPRTRSLGAIGFDWYDPVASHAFGRPGRRNAWGAHEWSPGRPLWDVLPDADGLRAWCRTEAALHPALPLWVVENGMATRMVDGYPVPRRDGWDRPRFLREHFAALVAATEEDAPVTLYLHWSLVDNYEWGSYEPRFGLFGLDRNAASGAIRWLDTDAAGHDSAAAFAHIVSGVLRGDRSVLDSTG